MLRELLSRLEGSGADLAVSLAYLAGSDVELHPDEVNAAVRRSELLLATGGDPRRDLDPESRAVTSLAADLDSAAARTALHAGLERLAAGAYDLPEVAGELTALLTDGDRAWRSFACALLADALAED